MADRPQFFKNLITLHRFKKVLKRFNKVVQIPNDLSRTAENAEKKVLEEQVNDILSNTFAEALRKYKTGARLQPVSNYSINQLTKLPIDQIANIKGVGPKSAQIIKDCAIAYAEDVKSKNRLHISSDHRTAPASTLVKSLYQTDKFQTLSAEGKYLKDSYVKDDELLAKARPAAHPLLWLFSKDRENAQQCMDEISELLQSPLITELTILEEKRSSILRVQHDMYWAAFDADPTRFYSLLESVKDRRQSKAGPASATSYLDIFSPSLRKEIEQVEVRTAGLTCVLRPYQVMGVKYALNQGNVLLGDEMGLGKTIEAIAALVSLRNGGCTHFAVICPASVLVNWQREISKYSDLKPFVLHGKNFAENLEKWESGGGVVITNYENTSRFYSKVRISMTVVDEAHYIKNYSASRTRNTIRILTQSDRRLFLSGTPLENKLEEMVSLISLLQPNIVKEVYRLRQPINAQQFRQVIAPVYFRRTKDAVWREMPDLQTVEEIVSLTSAERQLYINCINERSMEAFTTMRQISFAVSDEQSSKLKRIQEICDEAIENERKVIIFSFYLNTISRIQNYMKGAVYGPITGSISPQKRQDLIDEFSAHEGGAVLLSQIVAGGTGLNIQKATIVILCEPQYKPSIENQAVARAYRIGQNSKVTVYRMISEKTVDERILQVLKEKQAIFDAYADKSVSGEKSLAVKESDIANAEFEQSMVS